MGGIALAIIRTEIYIVHPRATIYVPLACKLYSFPSNIAHIHIPLWHWAQPPGASSCDLNLHEDPWVQLLR